MSGVSCLVIGVGGAIDSCLVFGVGLFDSKGGPRAHEGQGQWR